MATTRLADTRTMTLDDAKAAFADLAQAQLRVERRAAAAEVKIATIKARLVDDNAVDGAIVKVAAERLTAFILANRPLFEQPRQVKTEYGRFGLRDATRLEVQCEDVLIEALLDRGYDDCLVTRRTLVKDRIRTRIEAGEDLPGVRVLTGDVATYTVDKALVEEARKVD